MATRNTTLIPEGLIRYSSESITGIRNRLHRYKDELREMVGKQRERTQAQIKTKTNLKGTLIKYKALSKAHGLFTGPDPLPSITEAGEIKMISEELGKLRAQVMEDIGALQSEKDKRSTSQAFWQEKILLQKGKIKFTTDDIWQRMGEKIKK